MAVAIRPAEPADIDGVRRVADGAWREAHAPIIGVEAVESFLDDHYDAASFRSLIEREAVLFDVAEIDDAVVGFASVAPGEVTPKTFHLSRIYVDPDRWGKGIGRRLLTHVERSSRDRGGTRITLGVMAENDRAVGFYEAAGYDRKDAFYDDRIETPGYTYAKSL